MNLMVSIIVYANLKHTLPISYINALGFLDTQSDILPPECSVSTSAFHRRFGNKRGLGNQSQNVQEEKSQFNETPLDCVLGYLCN